MQPRHLITGAQGFVGRYLCAHLLETQTHARVLGLGRSPGQNQSFTHTVTRHGSQLPAPLLPSLCLDTHTRYGYQSADICHKRALISILREFQPTHIYHLASGLRDDPVEKLCRTNIQGVVALLEAIIESGTKVRKIVLGSTGGVYGNQQSLPIAEEAVCMPTDVYSATKLAFEHVSRILAEKGDLPVVWARIFNIVGPGQDERHCCGSFTARIQEGLGQGEPFTLQIGNLDPTRDFIDVRDVARGLGFCANEAVPGNAYNLASGRETSIGEVLNVILDQSEARERIRLRESNAYPAGVPRHVACIEKLIRLGFKPKYSLAESLSNLWSYYDQLVMPVEAGS